MINFGPATITWESTNQLVNGDFELWSSGNNANNWAVSGTLGTIAQENSTVYSNNYSAKIISNNTNLRLYQNFHNAKGISFWKNKTVQLRAKVFSSTNNAGLIYLYDGVNSSNLAFSGNNNNWQSLNTSLVIASNATLVSAYVAVYANNNTAFFDHVEAVEGPYNIGKTIGGGSIELYYHNSIGMYTKNLSSLIYGGEGVLHMFQWNNTFSFNNNSPMLYDYGKLTIACNNITYTIDCAKLFLAPSYSFGTFTQHPIDIHFSFKKSPDTGNYITIS